MFNSKRIEKLEEDMESVKASIKELRRLLGIEVKKTVETGWISGKDYIKEEYVFKTKTNKKNK